MKKSLPCGLVRPLRCASLALTVFAIVSCSVPPAAIEEASDTTRSNAEQLSAGSYLKSLQPGTILARSHGTSMEPQYHSGWIFLIAPTKWEDLRVGYVVAYRNSRHELIVHRLTHDYGDSWLIQGDNNPNPDAEVVTPQNLVGVVYGCLPSSALDNNP